MIKVTDPTPNPSPWRGGEKASPSPSEGGEWLPHGLPRMTAQRLPSLQGKGEWLPYGSPRMTAQRLPSLQGEGLGVGSVTLIVS